MWTSAADISEGAILRPIDRGGKLRGERMTEKVVWQLLRPYARAAGVPGIAPHDLRRYAACRTMPNPNAAAWPEGCGIGR